MYNIFTTKGGDELRIHDYHTAAGKNLIKEYLHSLPHPERYVGYHIRHMLGSKGLLALEELDTRQLTGKLWEIKFSKNRIMYVVADKDSMYMVHACKKQKGKAELFEIDTARRRVKELGLTI
jgi:phage-related protein